MPERSTSAGPRPVAVVTGGATGIGLGIARAAVRGGATTVLIGRRRERLDEAVAELRAEGGYAHAIVADVTEVVALEGAAAEVEARWGRLDLLVNNAGIGGSQRVADASPEVWDRMLAVNLRGVTHGIHAFLPLLRRTGRGGHIVNTASMAGLLPIVAGVYSATKAAVVALSEALALELRDEGIGVSAFCPGPTHSEISGTRSDRGEGDIPPYLPADEVGERVLAGVRRGDLFILTHPEFASGVADRHRAIEGAFPREPVDPVRAEAFAWLIGSDLYLPRDGSAADRARTV